MYVNVVCAETISYGLVQRHLHQLKVLLIVSSQSELVHTMYIVALIMYT